MPIHKNMPGVLAQVNEKLLAAGINIAAQHLSTNEDVADVVIDVDHAATQPALVELCTVPATIRPRMLVWRAQTNPDCAAEAFIGRGQ